jgi:hypothetical protein
VHTGDLLTTEQEISITLLIHDDKCPLNNSQRAFEVTPAQPPRNFIVLVWTDSNGDGTTAKVPLPGTPSFLDGNLVASFCPVILDRSHVATLSQAFGKVGVRNQRQSQKLSFLPSPSGARSPQGNGVSTSIHSHPWALPIRRMCSVSF